MAFLQPIEITQTGVAAQYWRLTHVQADFTAGIIEAQLHGYLDEAARRSGKNPLSVMAFRFPAAALLEKGQLGIPAIYAAIRTAPDSQNEDAPPVFAEATNI